MENEKDRIPESGEQVILEDGTIVIGDGIHSIKDLPKPKVLHG
jgi:hypothetical protein